MLTSYTVPVGFEVLPLFPLRGLLLVIPGRIPWRKYEAVPATVIGEDGGELDVIPSITCILGTVIRAGQFILAHGAPPLLRIRR
jgi:hypothetical protein